MNKLKFVVGVFALTLIAGFGATKANAWCDPLDIYCGFTITADIWSQHDDVSRYRHLGSSSDYCTPGPDSSRWRGRSDIYRIHNPGDPFTLTLDWEDDPNSLLDDLVLVVLEDCDANRCIGSDYHTLEFSTANGNAIVDDDANGIWVIVDSRTDIHKEYTLSAYCGDFPFAVELMSFSASRSADGIALNWSTASETDNDRFEVSRRDLTGDDWMTVAVVNGQGNSAARHDYSFVDRNINNSGYSYELAGYDVNGVRQVFGTVEVEAATPVAPVLESYELVGNYPNPFNPTTNIRFALVNATEVQLTVYDIAGREVADLVNGMVEAGVHDIEFDASGLSSGVYFAQLRGAFGSDVMKMVLMK